MNIKEILFELSNADAVGNIREASDLAYSMLSQYAECEKTDNLTVLGFLKGESDYTLMLDAHIDQIAMVVTNVNDKGFLTVAKAGGIDVRSLPSRRVSVYGKEKISAVFCSTPPHLSKSEKEYTDIAELKIDTMLGEKAKEIVSVGDLVTFSSRADSLVGSLVTGRSFDNRSSVACLIEVAHRLKTEKLPFNVVFVLSDSEELGLRGIRPATFKINPDEAIVVDVSFGVCPEVSKEDAGELGKGGMVGVAASLDKAISQKLIKLSEENNIPYQIEAAGGSTGTNADMISVTGDGVRTATLYIPLRNMHTETEVLDLKDLESVCDLLCKYILSGGVKDA